MSLSGIAEIISSSLVQLTNNTKVASGRALYPSPFHFRNSGSKPASFSTTFVFAIVPEYSDVSGYGMTFALSPTKEPLGAIKAPFFGLFNDSNSGNASNHIVAIELDTSRPHGFLDIDGNHVGIDIHGSYSLNSSPVAYFDNKNELKSLKLTSGYPIQIWIDYRGEDMKT